MSRRTLIALWLTVALIGVMGFKLEVATDMFWQVKLGQIILQEGRIPQFDRFTYTHAGEPVPRIYWLAQTLFASLYGLGGWRLTRAVNQIALVGSLLVAAATCRRDRTSPLSVSIAMSIAFLIILANAELRPQTFGLLCFAVLLALARGQRPLRVKLIVAAPLMVVWQNMHPSIVLGIAALCALAAADFLDRTGDESTPWSSVVLALVALALQFATPLGFHIFDVSRDNLRISRDVLRIPEWLHPWDSAIALEAIYFYWLALVGSSVAIIWFWNRLSIRDRLLFFVMTGLSLYAARFMVFWAVASIPLWADLIDRLIPLGMFAWARGRGDRASRGARPWMFLAAGFAIIVCFHLTRFGSNFGPEISLDGVRALRAELPSGARIYCDFGWGGPLLLEGSPDWRVSVDGRLYFFSDPAEWQSIDDARAGRIPLDELERTHRPDAFFLYPGRDRALIDVLSTCPRWRACFSGPTCVAFVRAR